MTEPKGYLSIVLHAHLPYIRHPEHAAFLEENWLFEAITDCYIPLLDVFAGLHRDRVPWRLAMSLTPPLVAMLHDDVLRNRYEQHVRGLIELADREVDRTRHDAALHRLAHMYRDRFAHTLHAFTETYNRDVPGAFARWQAAGHLEIVASAATHAYLPLVHPFQPGAAVQIDVGLNEYRRVFHREPRGFWLPECGYTPHVGTVLADRGLGWTIVESHGVLHARPRPRRGVHGPLFAPRTDGGPPLALFARDVESSKQVWSATEGYPGDFDYRDFYRDIGYDLDFDDVRPWLKADVRGHTGIKYYRITGAGDHKELYNPDAAREKAALHAGNFMFNRQAQVQHLRPHMDRPPLIVAPYDAELFGHWWFEGPQWLDFLIRKLAFDQQTIRLVTPSDYLALHPDNDAAAPSPSSWGYGGYSEVWLNGANDWIYRHLHTAEARLHHLAAAVHQPSELAARALTQALRELLLAQSSDWAFIMSAGTHVDYAVRRTITHVAHCQSLCDQVSSGRIDDRFLSDLESRHRLFPHLDYTVLRTASPAEGAVFNAASATGSDGWGRAMPVSV